MTQIQAWGATSPDSGLAEMAIVRRPLRSGDVAIEIRYCGVCHSDLHTARNDWGRTRYPVVPGHEIVGIVTAIGTDVDSLAIGDRVAVGCMVDSCLACDACLDGQEQYCREGMSGTYGGTDRIDGSSNHGGYSSDIVVRKEFVLRLPETLDIARAAPLLCAGITTYAPLRQWKVGPGTQVGVIGLGGLGHMGIKLAKALGAHVTVLTTSATKAKDAAALGADRVLLSTDRGAMKAATRSFDFLLDTIPVAHDLQPYLSLLDRQGTLCIVGAVDVLPSFHSALLLSGQRAVAGSAIGGIAETQELLDFCAEHQILPECETIRIDEINEAYARMERSDVKYRFVIDMGSLVSPS